MEIRDQAVHGLDAHTGIDEDGGIPAAGMDHAPVVRHGLDGADGRRADTDQPASGGADAVQGFGGLRRHLVPLRVHLVVGDLLRLHRAEGAQAHMQQHRHDGDALLPDALQKRRGEVQAGRRRGGGAFGLGVDGLVALAVPELLMDVGRQGHLPQPVQQFLKDALVEEAHPAAAGFLHVVQHLAAQQAVPEGADRTGLQPPARADQGFPVGGVLPAEQKDLHRHAGVLLDAQQARGDDPRLVDHQGVAGIQVFDDIVKSPVLDAVLQGADHQQPAVVAGLDGSLGDELFRQFIVKVSGAHFTAPFASARCPPGGGCRASRASCIPRRRGCTCGPAGCA